jgi:hypothetical protein
VAIAICLFAILAIAGLIGKIHSAASVAAVPTPGLVIILATPQPEPVPLAPPAPVQVAYQLPAPRYVVAFAAPGGDVLGPIPEPAAGTIMARYGDAWLATSWEGSTVWIRAADVGMQIADLAPPPAPQVVVQPVYVSAPAPAYAAPTPTEQSYQVASDPPPAAAPAVVRKEDFKEPDAAARCAFIGCL